MLNKKLKVAIPGPWKSITPPLRHNVYAANIIQNVFQALTLRGEGGLISNEYCPGASSKAFDLREYRCRVF
ncbi:MAG: hypothetical protein AB7H97_19185 [Pseudobdellovibrionaceae bacterium]